MLCHKVSRLTFAVFSPYLLRDRDLAQRTLWRQPNQSVRGELASSQPGQSWHVIGQTASAQSWPRHIQPPAGASHAPSSLAHVALSVLPQKWPDSSRHASQVGLNAELSQPRNQ